MTAPESRALGAVPLNGLLFDVAAASAQGPRSENQDAFSIDAFLSRALVAVADGMGGERAGRLVADTALAALAEQPNLRSLDAARYALRAADEAVARAAQQAPAEREGMGCALALMALATDRAGELGWVCAHVGDVRILSRSPDGTVRLETRDHTPAYARWEAGEIALDEIPDSPGSNKLQRAVGRGGEADAGWIPVRPGWTYLLISDGVTKAMRLDELGQSMALRSAEEICGAIARKVEERGPDDNYTAVAVRVTEDGAAADTLPDPGPPPPRRAAAQNAPEVPVTTRRSPWGALLALLLSLAALGLAAYALMTVRDARRGDAARQAQVDSLREEVRTVNRRLLVPADSVPAAAGDTTRPAATAGQPPAANPTTPR